MLLRKNGKIVKSSINARVLKQVDKIDLKLIELSARVGSSPISGTIIKK